jgi:hypothetical protein
VHRRTAKSEPSFVATIQKLKLNTPFAVPVVVCNFVGMKFVLVVVAAGHFLKLEALSQAASEKTILCSNSARKIDNTIDKWFVVVLYCYEIWYGLKLVSL